jgi:hypothetical protein
MRFKNFLLPGLLLAILLPSCTYYCGKDKLVKHFTAIPPMIPAVYDYNSSFSEKQDYDIHDSIIEFYARLPIPDGKVAGQTDAIRRVLAKLVQKREVPEVNAFLMTLKQWNDHGTTSFLHPSGDYDFTEITFCSLLYLFGDKPDLLYPQTREHILQYLITNSGPKTSLRMPGFKWLMRETENHILMGEVSRYLKNQWLHEHGDTSMIYDNHKNGIEKWMLNHLDEKFRGGFYEFNSDPYAGYSMQALLTLFSFTHSDTIRHAANKLLNEVMYEYSLSSMNESRYTVFRRQFHRAKEPAFDGDPVSSIIRVLVSRKTGEKFNIRAKQHGLITLLLHYRLNDDLAGLLTGTEKNYFAVLGHGRMGAPEIYNGGKGYVISGGGMVRGFASQLGARPEMLLLNDQVGNRDSCFYLCAKGKMKQWNNTGVYRNFACANQPVHIPPQYKPVLEKDGWQVFHDPSGKLSIFTYSAQSVGLLTISGKSNTPDSQALNEIITANAGLNLKKQFMLPNQWLISYDLHSPKNRWVIKSINRKKVDRKIDKWPRISVIY